MSVFGKRVSAPAAADGNVTGRLSPSELAHVVDLAPDALAVLGAPPRENANDRRFLYLNRAFEELYGCSRREVIGRTAWEFFEHRSSREQFERTNILLFKGQPFANTRLMRRPDGTRVWIEVNFRPIDATGTATTRWVFVTRDITESRALQLRTAQLLMAVERTGEPMAIYAFDGAHWRYDFVNEAFLQLTGLKRDHVIGQISDGMLSPYVDNAQMAAGLAEMLHGREVRAEVAFRRRDGNLLALEFNGKPVRDMVTGKVASIVTVLRDVTEHKHRQRALEHAALHDPLTGLYNRRYLEHALDEAITRTAGGGHSETLLFMDLDGFKKVNDQLGHDVGDEVLVDVAEAFSSCVLGSDTLVRWGGDEFAALLPNCTIDDALHVAQRMIAALKERPRAKLVGTSIGAAAVRESLDATLKDADIACYAAKRSGGNCVVSTAAGREPVPEAAGREPVPEAGALGNPG